MELLIKKIRVMEYAQLFSTEGVLLPASVDTLNSLYREETLSLEVIWSGGFLDFIYMLHAVNSHSLQSYLVSGF